MFKTIPATFGSLAKAFWHVAAYPSV